MKNWKLYLVGLAFILIRFLPKIVREWNEVTPDIQNLTLVDLNKYLWVI